jgi:PAS domain S-box-containing protein
MGMFQMNGIMPFLFTFLLAYIVTSTFLYFACKIHNHSIANGKHTYRFLVGSIIGLGFWLIHFVGGYFENAEYLFTLNVVEIVIQLCFAIGSAFLFMFLYDFRKVSKKKLNYIKVIVTTLLTVLHFKGFEHFKVVTGFTEQEIILFSCTFIAISTSILFFGNIIEKNAVYKLLGFPIILLSITCMHFYSLKTISLNVSFYDLEVINLLLLITSVLCVYLLFVILKREKEVLSYERRYKSLFENSPNVVCEVDLNGNVISFNSHFKNLLKYNLNDDIKLTSFLALFPTNEKKRIKVAMQKIIEGHNEQFETVFISRENKIIPVTIVFIPIVIDGEVQGMFISGRDLTVEKSTKILLAHAEKDLKETVNQQQGMIFKYTKSNNDFLVSICKGELARKLEINTEFKTKQRIKDVFPDELLINMLKNMQMAWEGEDIEAETSYNNITFLTKYRPVFESGVVSHVIASCIDITESKQAQEELKSSENIYKKMLNTMNEGVIIYDSNGKIVKANKRAADILGLEYEELLKRKPLEVQIIAKDTHEESFQAMSCPSTVTYYEGKPVYNKIFSLKKSDTESIWVIFNSIPIYQNDKKSPEFVILTITDITEQKNQELKIRDSHSQLSTLIENLNHGIVMEDKERNIIFANKYIQKLFQFEDVNEILNTNVLTVLKGKKHLITRAEELLENIKAIPDSTDESKQILFKITDTKTIELIYIPIINLGNQIGGIWIFDDVTKRMENEALLLNAKEAAEKANHTKAKFLSSMSHELRTPLNAIIGFAQLMMYEVDDQLTETQHDNVNEILTAGRHLLKLINDILDFSHLEAGSISMRFTPLNITSIVDETINMLLPIASGRNISIVHETPKGVGVFVNADATRMKQVFLNLLSNGIKYNKLHGELKISYSFNNNNVVINITDTGIGIGQDELQKIFTPFYRTNQVNYTQEGTGIGLSLAKEFVERMGGVIGVESIKGEGSCFWIQFKLMENIENNLDIYSNSLKDISNSKTKEKVKLLYIEDNMSNIHLVRKLVKNEDRIDFHYAITGSEGISLAESLDPDIILLDIHLPDQSGLDVLRNLKERITCDKYMAISADVMMKKEYLYELGFNHVIKKPLKVDKFLNVIHSYIQSVKV